VPEGFRLDGFTCKGATVSEPVRDGPAIKVRLTAGAAATAAWRAVFSRG
jgi:hypothetical protein